MKDNQEQSFRELKASDLLILEKVEKGFAVVQEEQTQAAAKEKVETNYAREAFKTIGNNQVLIATDQKEHAQAIQELDDSALREL